MPGQKWMKIAKATIVFKGFFLSRHENLNLHDPDLLIFKFCGSMGRESDHD